MTTKGYKKNKTKQKKHPPTDMSVIFGCVLAVDVFLLYLAIFCL